MYSRSFVLQNCNECSYYQFSFDLIFILYMYKIKIFRLLVTYFCNKSAKNSRGTSLYELSADLQFTIQIL